MSQHSLQARNLSWQAGGGKILHDVSLDLRPGEILGIIGPNGAGKSSLLRILANLLPPDAGTRFFQGRDYARVPIREFAARLGYLEQHAQVHWPLLAGKVVEMGRFPYRGRFSGLTREDRRAMDKAVRITGIGHLLGRVVTRLSEGEKMLVSLTRLLAAEPEIVIADEPVAALDPYHQLLIMETFRELVTRQEDFSAIIVLHDLTLAAQFCQRLLLLNHGTITAAGPPRDVLTPDNLGRHYRIEADIDLAGKPARVVPFARRAEQDPER